MQVILTNINFHDLAQRLYDIQQLVGQDARPSKCLLKRTNGNWSGVIEFKE